MTGSHVVQANLSEICFRSVERGSAQRHFHGKLPHRTVTQQIKAFFLKNKDSILPRCMIWHVCVGLWLYFRTRVLVSSARLARCHVSFSTIRVVFVSLQHLVSRVGHKVGGCSWLAALCWNSVEVKFITHTHSISNHMASLIMWLFANQLPDKLCVCVCSLIFYLCKDEQDIWTLTVTDLFGK